MNRIRKPTHWKRLIFLSMCLMALTMLISCNTDDDDEGTIQIRNDDNHDYVVDLYRASDSALIDSLVVDEWPKLGSVDYFEDIDEDTYYLTIRRRGEDVIRAWSRTFELDDGDEECFVITTTGEIEDC